MSIEYFDESRIHIVNSHFFNNLLYIERSAEDRPEIALRKRFVNGKWALEIDLDAEHRFKKFAREWIPAVRVFGEECEEQNQPGFNLNGVRDICALVDMVDGTDLVERGLHNWCSSAVFFDPSEDDGKKILAAFIGVPFQTIYAGTRGSRPRVYQRGKPAREVAGPSDSAGFEWSSLSFYGQKAGRLQYTAGQEVFAETSANANMRVYNLAGMPMITKLIDKRFKDACGIDAVFELKGQKPHDVVPGAFLAMEAGCYVLNLDTGEPMRLEDLEASLMEPFAKKSELRYIIASTVDLGERIREKVKIG